MGRHKVDLTNAPANQVKSTFLLGLRKLQSRVEYPKFHIISENIATTTVGNTKHGVRYRIAAIKLSVLTNRESRWLMHIVFKDAKDGVVEMEKRFLYKEPTDDEVSATFKLINDLALKAGCRTHHPIRFIYQWGWKMNH